MCWVTLKGLLARRARLLLTTLAVALGVTLLTGTLMLTDSTGRAVTRLVVGSQTGVDVVVRNAEAGTGPVQVIPASLLPHIQAVPGARAAAGMVLVEKAQVIGRGGGRSPISGRPTWSAAIRRIRGWPAR